MAGSYKYLLIGGAVVGIAAGSIAALAVGGGSTTKDGADARPAAQTPTSPPATGNSDQATAKNKEEGGATGELGPAAQTPTSVPARREADGTAAGATEKRASKVEQRSSAEAPKSAAAASKVNQEVADTEKGESSKTVQKPANQAPMIMPGMSEADKAAADNDAGKEKLFNSEFHAASELFRKAVARVADPKYFINLCSSLFQEGKFDESLVACAGVLSSGPTEWQRSKALLLANTVLAECDSQHVVCHAPDALKKAIAKNK